MRILVACEESQRVCAAFRAKDHEAYSCDIKPCSGGFPEWHFQQDVVPLLEQKWDMIIAFPPCTFLSNAGARHLYKNHELNIARYEKGKDAALFFMKFYNADCEKIAIENPLPSKIFNLPTPSQIIQLWMFGHPYKKRTLLWLKGLPLLQSTDIVEPVANWCPSGSYSHKHDVQHKGMFTSNRAENRSKTFENIAFAMAEQWGCL